MSSGDSALLGAVATFLAVLGAVCSPSTPSTILPRPRPHSPAGRATRDAHGWLPASAPASSLPGGLAPCRGCTCNAFSLVRQSEGSRPCQLTK